MVGQSPGAGLEGSGLPGVVGVGWRGLHLGGYDRLGVGVSDRDLRDDDLTLDGEVGLLGAVVDELGLETIALVGRFLRRLRSHRVRGSLP
jgi:hypothetical protein